MIELHFGEHADRLELRRRFGRAGDPRGRPRFAFRGNLRPLCICRRAFAPCECDGYREPRSDHQRPCNDTTGHDHLAHEWQAASITHRGGQHDSDYRCRCIRRSPVRGKSGGGLLARTLALERVAATGRPRSEPLGNSLRRPTRSRGIRFALAHATSGSRSLRACHARFRPCALGIGPGRSFSARIPHQEWTAHCDRPSLGRDRTGLPRQARNCRRGPCGSARSTRRESRRGRRGTSSIISWNWRAKPKCDR